MSGRYPIMWSPGLPGVMLTCAYRLVLELFHHRQRAFRPEPCCCFAGGPALTAISAPIYYLPGVASPQYTVQTPSALFLFIVTRLAMACGPLGSWELQ